jgi:hypothetical protein
LDFGRVDIQVNYGVIFLLKKKWFWRLSIVRSCVIILGEIFATWQPKRKMEAMNLANVFMGKKMA